MNEIKDLKIVVLVSGNGSNLQALIDASKLKVSLTNWSGLKLIHAIEYDGETYCASGGDTIGKSMNCWIEDYR